MNVKTLIITFMIMIMWGFGLGCFIKNKRIYELEQINNQLRLEYDELKLKYHELDWEVTGCYYTLNRTEEYCHANKGL